MMSRRLFTRGSRAHVALLLFGLIGALTFTLNLSTALAQPTGLSVKAPKRLALVIGAQTYQDTASLPPLRTPLNDARQVSAKLRSVGVETIDLLDPTAAALQAGVERFLEKVASVDVAIVYYAGHGFQAAVEGAIPDKLLLPVDFRDPAAGKTGLDRAVAIEGAIINGQVINLGRLTDFVQRAGKVGIVFWDACRNNPYYAAPVALSSNTRALVASRSVGLARSAGGGAALAVAPLSTPSPVNFDAPHGVIIHNATLPGRVADDGTGQHSPYATALLKHLTKRGQSIVALLQAVATDVLRATKGVQTPQMENNLTGGDVFLVQPLPSQPPSRPSAAGATSPQTSGTQRPSSAGGGGAKDCVGQGCQSTVSMPNGQKIVIETKGIAPF